MMRKNIQCKLLEMISTIEDANETLLSLIHNDGKEALFELLTDMQSFAIEIGNKVEELEGEGSKAVSLLEAFCETVWRCSQAQGIREREHIIFEMKVLTLEIEEEIKKTETSYDVVFLPYKASMWDSMESVWRAAKEDDRCNCYVIPIPYYDKNKDGSFGKMHYEGELFPEYVTITHYDSYSIQENNPEIIYIHNPYDSFNHITSVEPLYYSKELKKYTNMLVYIPYFCTDGELAKGHEQFVSYYMADKIIVQNERTREALLEHNDALPKERVVTLGSPKFDRMFYLDQNKPEVVDEWKDILSGKKVFLYNTSIGSMLNDGSKILEKMESIFKAFNGREDVALIWRPHPLLRPTLESMRPELANRYDRLIQWYIEDRIGIYDTTPDVNKTIAISDAYIGEEGSSVVHLAGVLGKPIFITSEEVYEQHTIEELSKIEFLDCEVEGNLIWFVSLDSHLLCQMDTNTGSVEILGKAPETEDVIGISYSDIVKYQNRLIMMPYSANGICEYNLTTRQFSKHYFNREEVSLKFGRMIQYKNDLYLLPQEYSAIIRYNIDNRQITYYHKCIEDIRSKMTKKYEWSPFLWGTCTYDNLLFLASAWSNHILVFNMDTEEYVIHEVGDAENTYRGMVSDETYCWLILQNKSCVVKWNRHTGEVARYDEYPENYVSGNLPFKNILKFEDRIYLISCHSSHSIEMDADTGFNRLARLNKLNAYINIEDDHGIIWHNFGKRISNQSFCVFQPNSHSYIEIDVDKGIRKEVICRIDKEGYTREAIHLLKYRQLKNRYSPFTLIEYEDNLLTRFIEYVKSDEHDKDRVKALYNKITEYADGSSGVHIHEHVKKSANI